jgi:MtN3 and saliva related transmembrane protein
MINFTKHIIAYQELIGYVAAGLGAASFLSQVIKIWKSRSTKDISIAMYVMYIISLLMWLIYGIIIWSKPLIIAEIVTLILGLLQLKKIEYILLGLRR